MFDKKKIILNHIRSFNKKNKRAIDFFEAISNILIEKTFDENKDYKNINILELASRNDILRKKILYRFLKSIYFQTCISEEIKVKNNNKVVSNLNDIVFQQKTFDYCFSLFYLNSVENVPLIFKNIYNILKVNGTFVSVVPSDECFKEFRSFFTEFLRPKKNYNFNPLFDIQTLGNLCSASGFKNVVVDKETFQFNLSKPEDLWRFIRHVGESNYLLNRKDFIIKKSIFKEFYNIYSEKLKKGILTQNTLSIFFLIGKK